MMALGADRVVREGVVLNPRYRTMALFGSEYWTYVLPRRVGNERARQLTERCPPIDASEAVAIGLADVALPGTRARFGAAISDCAAELAADASCPRACSTTSAAAARPTSVAGRWRPTASRSWRR
jgi:putative two-component system hydrogenase maturation factor HypX/HoxX